MHYNLNHCCTNLFHCSWATFVKKNEPKDDPIDLDSDSPPGHTVGTQRGGTFAQQQPSGKGKAPLPVSSIGKEKTSMMPYGSSQSHGERQPSGQRLPSVQTLFVTPDQFPTTTHYLTAVSGVEPRIPTLQQAQSSDPTSNQPGQPGQPIAQSYPPRRDPFYPGPYRVEYTAQYGAHFPILSLCAQAMRESKYTNLGQQKGSSHYQPRESVRRLLPESSSQGNVKQLSRHQAQQQLSNVSIQSQNIINESDFLDEDERARLTAHRDETASTGMGDTGVRSKSTTPSRLHSSMSERTHIQRRVLIQ